MNCIFYIFIELKSLIYGIFLSYTRIVRLHLYILYFFNFTFTWSRVFFSSDSFSAAYSFRFRWLLVLNLLLYILIKFKYIYFFNVSKYEEIQQWAIVCVFFMEMCLVEFFDTFWPFKWCAKIMSVVKLYLEFFYCLENY